MEPRGVRVLELILLAPVRRPALPQMLFKSGDRPFDADVVLAPVDWARWSSGDKDDDGCPNSTVS